MADREVVQDEEEVILDLGNEDMDLIQFFIDNKNKKIIPRYPDSYCSPSFEANNTTKVDQDEKSNPYELNLSTPKENYRTILKWAVIPETACGLLKVVTKMLIRDAKSLEDLMKPIAALQALREHYIINNDPKSYNEFMSEAKQKMWQFRKDNMWSEFINSGIGLITNVEMEGSDISREEAEEFEELEYVKRNTDQKEE